MTGGRGDATPFLFLRERRRMERRQGLYQMTWRKWFLMEISGKAALRSSKYFFDHAEVRSTANPKLTLWAQTLDLRPFHFTKNGYQKFFHVCARGFGQQPGKMRLNSYVS